MKPNRRGEPSINFLMSVPLPTPDGPHMTKAEGLAATSVLFWPSACPCASSDEYVPPMSFPLYDAYLKPELPTKRVRKR